MGEGGRVEEQTLRGGSRGKRPRGMGRGAGKGQSVDLVSGTPTSASE
jgi:hypothetical protein